MQEAIQKEITHSFLDNLHVTSSLPVDLVEKAQEVIASTPLPTTRVEAWKYTRVAKLGKRSYQSGSTTQEVAPQYQIAKDTFQIAVVNGRIATDLSSLSLPKGVYIKSFSELEEKELQKIGSKTPLDGEIFNAVNTAYLQDGIYIEIAKNCILEKPVEITHLTTGENQLVNFRVAIVGNVSSQAEIIFSSHSDNADNSFTNLITEVQLEENASLIVQKLQNESSNSNQIASEYICQQKNSRFGINTLTLNGALVRNNLHIAVEGENCETNLNGAYLLKDKQHVDNHTIVDHRVANCISNELYKGVMNDKSTAVFNGKVFVRQDAQKINAFQSNGNVLLSDDATINSKPELEIYADDVKCSHGSTTGQLDEEAVFYLKTRGLSDASARHLMVTAFIGEVLEKIDNEDVLNFVYSVLENRFGWKK